MDCMEEVTTDVSQVEEGNLPQLQETVTSMIREHPEDAAHLIRTWLLGDDRRKAGVLLVALGSDISAEIYKCLRVDEIETLTFEIARLETISPDQKEAVLQEFHNLLQTNRFASIGGIDFARELLEKSVGSQKAIEIICRLTSSLQVRPFDFIRRTDPAHLLNFIQSERPQTIALVLSYLMPDKAAVILDALPHEIQSEVARRIATMDKTSPEVLREVERVLEKKLSTLSIEDYTASGGVENIVEILNLVDRSSEKQIIEALEAKAPELAEEIKQNMFIFEDIVMLDDRSIQKVMREVDAQELAKALKIVDVEIQDKIFRNMSKRAAAMLKEDMEFMGPIRLKDVEESQSRIISIIRNLEDTGEIGIARAGEDDYKLVGGYADSTFQWSHFSTLSRANIERVLQGVDYKTLITALKLTQTKVYKKITEPMGVFKRLKLAFDIKRLKDLDVDDVVCAQDKIVSIVRRVCSEVQLSSSEDIKEERECLKC